MKSTGTSQGRIGRFAKVAIASFMALTMLFAFGCNSNEKTGGDDIEDGTDITEDTTSETPIKSVKTLGAVEVDGVKLQAVVVEYDEDLTGVEVSTSTYTVTTYDPKRYDYIGDGKVGDVLNAYVNSTADIDAEGKGDGTGHYVILEMFTDFLATAELAYTSTLIARVVQNEDLTLSDGTVLKASSTYATNLVNNKLTSEGYSILGLEDFEWYTNLPGDIGADGPAFHWDHCFNQQDGLYYDMDLAYALWKPADWHAGGNYGLVTLQNPASGQGTHPMVTVVTTRSPSYYASDELQNYVKETHGLDGLIVLVPVVTQRVNDNGGTPAEYECIVHLWDYIIDKYSVNPDYVYGSGQSVGGMILLETQRNRDNFFAGLLLYEDQWAQNYYLETIFERDMVANESIGATAAMHYPRTDSYVTWDYSLDTDGNPVYENHDPYNLYYLMSDDNILIMNQNGNDLCIDTWNELVYLYHDLVGYDLENVIINAQDDLDTQNEQLEEYFNRNKTQTCIDGEEYEVNINWVMFNYGSNGYSCRKVDSSYYWLLSQSRTTEVSRKKLDLNKPFVVAENQIQTEERTIYFTDADGGPLYYITGQAGAGTQFYNTGWYNLAYIADAAPGWLPGDMSWFGEGNGVTGGYITSVTVINDTTIAVEYNVDMTGLVVNLKGDKVYNHITGEYRDDDLIVLDPFCVYTVSVVDGEKVYELQDVTVKNVYVNSEAAAIANAARGSGSGNFVIVELDKPVSSIDAVLQRLAVRTHTVISPASYKIYDVTSAD